MSRRVKQLAGSGLDAPLSPAKPREIAAQRQRERFGRVIDPTLEGGNRLHAEANAALTSGAKPSTHYVGTDFDERRRVLPDRATMPIRAQRWINGFRCTIRTAPRTKKNSTTLGIRQSPAYRAYRDLIVNGFAPLLANLQLPLEDRPYNLAATFYVDRWGERADLIGLLQGLADALQNAGVVSDDHWFRSLDRSRIVAGDASPRVEVLITTLD